MLRRFYLGPVNSLFCLTIASCLIFSLLLFVGLDQVPAPLFQDESDGLYRILHYARTGKDITGSFLPFMMGFGNGFASYTHPAYFVPVSIISKLAGPVVSVGELRSAGVLYCIATSFLVFRLSRLLGMRPLYGVFASFLYLSSPLSQLSSRVAWDPVSLPFWYLLAILSIEYFFSALKSPSDSCRKNYIVVGSSLVGLAIAFLWWGYPPGRLLSLCLEAYFLFRIFRSRSNNKLLAILVQLSAFLFLLAPVVISIRLDPEIGQRSSDLLNQFTLLGLYSSFKSLLSQLTYADYLLFWGDPERRHSTGFGGVLGFGGVIILISSFLYIFFRSFEDNKSNTASISLSSFPLGRIILYVLVGTLPAAVTFDEFHSLRSAAAFPLWAILSALCLERMIESAKCDSRLKRVAFLLVLSLGIAYGLSGWNYMCGYKSFLSDAQQGATYRGQSKSYFQNSAYNSINGLSDADIINRVKSIKGYPGTTDSRVLFEYYSRRLDKSNGPVFFYQFNRGNAL